MRYGIYESNEEMLARVMGGNSGWDIVFPTNYIVKPMLANGLLAPIHRDQLPESRRSSSHDSSSRIGIRICNGRCPTW